MNKKLIFVLLVFAFALLALDFASAYSYSTYYSWDRLNYDIENRVVHNKVYDYFKYGSYWQHYGNWPAYKDYSYFRDYYPKKIKVYYKNKFRYEDYPVNIKIYDSNPPRPIGRLHSGDRTYVINCGHTDGFYRDCY